MNDTPRETLIAALEKVDNQQQDDISLQNVLRMIHQGYAEIIGTVIHGGHGRVVVRRYHLRRTDAGDALLEAARE